jgi:ADP-ribose pyrophosphatase
MPLKRWIKLSQKTVHKNDHWSYYLDEFMIENGEKGEYHYVHTLGSSMVIPITSNKNFILVNQYRYLNQKESIEFPCGSIEPNLSPEENALKELREESGYSSNKLILVSEFSPYTGACDEMCKVFIGTELVKSPLPNDKTEEFELVELSFDEVEKKIEENEIWDYKLTGLTSD